MPLLFEGPFSVSQIEIITNNSDVLGKESFKALKNRSGIEILTDDAFLQPNTSALCESLIFAIKQLSINLTESEI